MYYGSGTNVTHDRRASGQWADAAAYAAVNGRWTGCDCEMTSWSPHNN